MNTSAPHATAAAWQPRSHLLAVAEKSGVIRFLVAPDFRSIEEAAASGSIDVLAFSRDGKRLAWGGSDGAFRSHLTQLIEAAHKGDGQTAADLVPLVYDELWSLTAAKMAYEAPGHTAVARSISHGLLVIQAFDKRCISTLFR